MVADGCWLLLDVPGLLKFIRSADVLKGRLDWLKGASSEYSLGGRAANEGCCVVV